MIGCCAQCVGWKFAGPPRDRAGVQTEMVTPQLVADVASTALNVIQRAVIVTCRLAMLCHLDVFHIESKISISYNLMRHK